MREPVGGITGNQHIKNTSQQSQRTSSWMGWGFGGKGIEFFFFFLWSEWIIHRQTIDMINSSISPLLWIDSEQLSNSSPLHFHYPELFTKQLLGIILGSKFSAGDVGADVSGISASRSFGSEVMGRPQAFHHEDLVSRFWATLIRCGRAERLDGPVFSSIRQAEFCKSGFPPWILMFTN